MKNVLFRPELLSEVEMCSICGRGVGMVYSERELKNPSPFMCWVCELRFPAEQWEEDEQGLYFNLSQNGGVDMIPEPGTTGGRLKPWLRRPSH